MRQRIITGIIFALAVAAIVVPGYWQPLLPVAFFTVTAYLVTHELREALANVQIHISPYLPLINALLVLLPRFLTSSRPDAADRIASVSALTLFVIFAIMGTTTVLQLIRENPKSLPDASANALLMAYVALPLSCPVIIMTAIPDGFFWMVLGLVTPWVSDTAAFFAGTLFGRHKIVPRLSPKKTVEGTIGGIIGTMLVVMLYFWLFMQDRQAISQHLAANLLLAGAAGSLLSIASQMGDWLASAIKRWCGVKDFGAILPGHGGILDRFDSVLFTMPVALAVATLAVVLS